MALYFSTCRFCGAYSSDTAKFVRYSVRHYACHACYLDSGKTLEALKPHQVGAFPWKVLRDRGLMAKAEAILSKRAEG